jgi:hypothetical protein
MDLLLFFKADDVTTIFLGLEKNLDRKTQQKKITSSPQYKGNAPNKGTQAYTNPCGWTII